MSERAMNHKATLNEIMEFDHVVFVDEVGHVHSHDVIAPGVMNPRTGYGANSRTHLYSPELIECNDGDPIEAAAELQRQARAYGWDGLMAGYTGQYGYRGPVMHESEFIGGGMARAILERPGWYCVTAVNYIGDNYEEEGPELSGWAVAYREIRSEDDGPWVDIVFMDGDDYSECCDMCTDELIEHLSQWDYGQETDDAHTMEAYPWGSSDRVERVGQYVLTTNYHMGYVSLNRRPMGAVVTA